MNYGKKKHFDCRRLEQISKHYFNYLISFLRLNLWPKRSKPTFNFGEFHLILQHCRPCQEGVEFIVECPPLDAHEAHSFPLQICQHAINFHSQLSLHVLFWGFPENLNFPKRKSLDCGVVNFLHDNERDSSIRLFESAAQYIAHIAFLRSWTGTSLCIKSFQLGRQWKASN